MTSLLIGFDSAWTATKRGAIISAVVHDDGSLTELGDPRAVSFAEAQSAIEEWRRIYNPQHYDFLQSFQGTNTFISVAAFCLGASQIFFAINFIWSLFAGRRASENPWQANTLEWTAPSPPPHGNFVTTPVVYRGPYEYSSPEVAEDWLPQTRRLEGVQATGSGH